jgi:NTE family protein
MPSWPSSTDSETLAKIRTRLNPFSEAEQCSLINLGYAVCDAAVRRFANAPSTPAPTWPYPDFALDAGTGSRVQMRKTTDLIQPPPSV